MARADLATALDWAAAEGWNPGLDDADAFLAADPAGFLIGVLDGEPVACISLVNYGDSFSFLGLYICRPGFRRRGFGRALWEAALAHAGARTIGLDGVVAEQARYAADGFAFAYRNVRYGGIASATEIGDMRIVELRPSRPNGLAGAVATYDAPLFPGPRVPFLRAWLVPPGRRTIVWVEENSIRGYASIRACREGYKVGPLMADSELVADRLLGALVGRLRGASIFIDVPEPNLAAVAMALRNGLAPAFETARMYRGTPPILPLDRIYAVTTLELG